MKFPTIPRHFPLKTFGEVFNRLLNAYCLKMKMLRRCFAGGDAMVYLFYRWSLVVVCLGTVCFHAVDYSSDYS